MNSLAGRDVVVTGAAGFIGSHLVEALLARGARVTALVRRTTDRRWLDPARVRFALGDVADEGPAGEEAVEAAARGAAVFFHVAGITQARRPDDFARVNTAGAARAARAASRAGVPRFVLVSSQAAGGPTRGEAPRAEADPDTPVGAYGRSKLEGERLAQAALASSATQGVVVRPPAVYGPRDTAFLQLFRLVSHGVVPLHRADRQWVSVVHVRDLAQGLVLAAERGAPGAVYYVGGGPPVTGAALVDAIAAALHKRPLRLEVPAAVLRAAVSVAEGWSRLSGAPPRLTRERLADWIEPRWTVSDERARRELEYASRIGLGEGIEETAAWYRTARWI